MGLILWILTSIVAPFLVPLLGAWWVRFVISIENIERLSLSVVTLGWPGIAILWNLGAILETLEAVRKSEQMTSSAELFLVLLVLLIVANVALAMTGAVRRNARQAHESLYVAGVSILTLLSATAYVCVHMLY